MKATSESAFPWDKSTKILPREFRMSIPKTPHNSSSLFGVNLLMGKPLREVEAFYAPVCKASVLFADDNAGSGSSVGRASD